MKKAVEMVLNLMAVAARTAPKAGGKDFLEIVAIVKDDDLKRIAEAMKAYAPGSTNEPFWLRDASNIENSDALLLIGLREAETRFEEILRRYTKYGKNEPTLNRYLGYHSEIQGLIRDRRQ